MILFDVRNNKTLFKLYSPKLYASFYVKKKGYVRKTKEIIKKYDIEAPSTLYDHRSCVEQLGVKVNIYFLNILEN